MKCIKIMKIVYIDMDGVLADFDKMYKRYKKLIPKIEYPQSQYGFFTDLDVIKDSINVCDRLLESDNYDPYILTAPSIHNPLCYTEKRIWVEKNMGINWVSRLIINPIKNLNNGDYLIDDRLSGNGQDLFNGELIHFGSDKFKNWKQVEDYLFSKSKVYNLKNWAN